MILSAEISVEIRDRTGQLKSVRKMQANSLVRAFIDILYTHLQGTNGADVNTPDTGNVQRDMNPSSASYICAHSSYGGAGDTLFGIVVGTGTAPVAISDYALGTKIAHGTGSGQLSYGATNISVPTTVGSTRKTTISRLLTNSSGSTINVTEVGIYAGAQASPSGTTEKFCIERTLNSFSILPSFQALVTYTISVSV